MDTPTTNEGSALEPGSQEHDAAMAAKYDAAQGNASATVDDRPPAQPEKLLAGKYKTADELEKAYKALEARLGSPKPSTQPEGASKASSAPTEASKGTVDQARINQEVSETGSISPESREAMLKAGLSSDVIDTIESGMRSQIQSIRDSAFEVAGGQDNFNAMREWADANLPASEKAFLEAQAMAGPEQAKMAVQAMKSRYEAAMGKQATLVQGQKATPSVGYESVYQMKQDMKNPSYQRDPAFRARVEAKLAATTAF